MNRFLFLIFIVFLVACTRSENNVFEWRGPNHSGKYKESDLQKSWSQKGPKLLWETNELGFGYSSPVVSGNQLFVVGMVDSISLLYSFDLNGKLLNKCEIGEEWVASSPGSRGTPTVAGNYVYTITGKGDLSCYDIKEGSLKWIKNLIVDFGGVSPKFGFAESPLVDGEKLFCVPGGPENNVVCLNRFSGDLIWSSKGKEERSAYNSAVLINVESKKILAVFSAYHLMGIDASNGNLLWVHEQMSTPIEKRAPGIGDAHGNPIVVKNSMIYYVAGDGNCAVGLKLSPDGSSIEQVWNNALVDNTLGGIVLADNTIFSSTSSKNDLVSIDVDNGVIADSLSIGRGSIIAADKRLYYYNMNGEVHLVNYKNKMMKDVSSFKIEKGSYEHFAHPVIDDGVLYIRHGEYMGAYKISD